MDTLAFTHLSLTYEDPEPTPQIPTFTGFGFSIPSSAWVGLMSVGLALSILTVTSEAMAALQRGDKGQTVREVQTALQQRGYDTGGVDGVFGAKTQYAVIRFQQRLGLIADGVIGVETARALGLNQVIVDAQPITPAPGGLPSGYARVITSDLPLNVRSGPGLNYPVVNNLASGINVSITGRRTNGWVELANGGWVTQQYLVFGSGTGGSTGVGGDTAIYRTVLTSGLPLNVRSGPGTNYAIINSLPNGTTVLITGRRSGGWEQLPGGGWVSSEWLR